MENEDYETRAGKVLVDLVRLSRWIKRAYVIGNYKLIDEITKPNIINYFPIAENHFCPTKKNGKGELIDILI